MDQVQDADVLVVDDDPEVCAVVQEYLSRHGLQVQTAIDASAARTIVNASSPKVALVNQYLPGESGLSFVAWLRRHLPRVGIIFLSGICGPADRIIGLAVGADDCLSKPFDQRELLAKIRGLLNRNQRIGVDLQTAMPFEPNVSSTVAFGDCQLNLDRHQLLAADGADIAITEAEFELLALLARSPNLPLSRDQITNQTNVTGCDVFDRSLDLKVLRLRRKIERDPDRPMIIKTVRRVGYVFVTGTPRNR